MILRHWYAARLVREGKVYLVEDEAMSTYTNEQINKWSTSARVHIQIATSGMNWARTFRCKCSNRRQQRCACTRSNL